MAKTKEMNEEMTAQDPAPVYDVTGEALDADKAKLDQLTATFPQEKIRSDPRGNPYYDQWTIVERFNEVMGKDWDHKVVDQGFVTRKLLRRNAEGVQVPQDVTEAWAVVSITITLPSGQRVTREQAGGSVANNEIGDALKGAISDAFKKAASLLGVGGELYVKGPERAVPSGTYNRPQQSQGYQQQAPVSADGEGRIACEADSCRNTVDGWPTMNPPKSPGDMASIGRRKFGLALCQMHYSQANKGNIPARAMATADAGGSDLPF